MAISVSVDVPFIAGAAPSAPPVTEQQLPPVDESQATDFQSLLARAQSGGPVTDADVNALMMDSIIRMGTTIISDLLPK